ncbi:MAG: hypothetical protein ACTSQI_00910 [Candidatus Helarchaeota archaeon]
MKEIGTNILYEIKGNKLLIEIDLNPKEKKESKSGKSLIIASSHGNKRIIEGEEIFLGLNLYEKIKKTEDKEKSESS